MPKALLVLSSHDRLGDTGKPTGWYLPEAAHLWQPLAEAGWEVDHASPAGGRPAHYGTDLSDPAQAAYVAAFGEDGPLTVASSDLTRAYDAVLYVGGHGAMWDLPSDPGTQQAARGTWERGGVVAAVCHGPAGLVDLRLSDGALLVAGRRVAAFTDSEEDAVGLSDVVPFLLARRLVEGGAEHVPAPDWQPQVVVDERLVTGQNPASASGVARAVLEVHARTAPARTLV